MPKSLTIDLNYNCNNDCQFCFNLYDKTKPFSVEQAKESIVAAKEQGVSSLDFYGGEPLLYKEDLVALLTYAHQLGLVSNLATNSTLLDADLITQFNNLGVRSIRTTLHGSNASMHDFITRRPGSFEQTITALQLLAANYQGIIIVNIVVTQLNYKFLQDIVNLINQLDPEGRIVLKFSHLFFNGQAEVYQRLGVGLSQVQPYLAQVVSDLAKQNKKFYLEKYPYCLALPFRNNFLAEADWDQKNIIWTTTCNACEFKNQGCLGFNVNYGKCIANPETEVKLLKQFSYDSFK